VTLLSDLLRMLLRTMTIVVIVMTGWLVSVVVGVLPERDPSSIGPWAAVAVASGGLASLALVATMRRDRLSDGLGRSFAVLSLAAIAFGLFVLTSLAIPSGAGHYEGYLLLVGLILGLEGAFGLGWLAALGTARR
jgi:hypothetical protein